MITFTKSFLKERYDHSSHVGVHVHANWGQIRQCFSNYAKLKACSLTPPCLAVRGRRWRESPRIAGMEDAKWVQKVHFQGFPGGAVVENLPANAGDTGSSPGLGRSHMPRSN